MSDLGTWGDLIDAADDEQFVGRERELEQFEQEIGRQEPRKIIFFVSGQGGVGKSTLLDRYRGIAEGFGFVVATSDEQQRDIPSVLGRFAEELADEGFELPRFAERYRTYRQRRSEIEADPDAPQGLAALVGRSLARVGLALSAEVPVLRQGVKAADQDALATQAGEWAAYLAKKVTNKDEVALLRDPGPILTSLFFDDLNEIAQEQLVLLAFDNYEVTRGFLDEWILRLREHRPSLNIRFVIGSRTPPGTSWDRLRNVVLHTPLNVFTEEEAEAFLDKHEIYDSHRRQEILHFSGRLPVLMTWLAAPEGEESGGEVATADIVDRFLRWVADPSQRQVALLAAIPRYYNLDTLTALLNQLEPGAIEAAFEWLREQPFVRQREHGWQYHDVVRRHLLSYERQKSEENYRNLHTYLAEHYDVRRGELNLSYTEHWTNERWRRWTQEHIYHHLLAAPDSNWANFVDHFVIALSYGGTELGHEFIEIIWLDPCLEELDTGQRRDVELFASQLEFIEQEDTLESAIEMIERLNHVPSLSAQSQVYVKVLRAFVRVRQGQIDLAIMDLTDAIQAGLDEVSAALFAVRARLFNRLQKLDEALQDFSLAIELDSDDTSLFIHRGNTYMTLKRYEEALADFNRAIGLEPDDASALSRRAQAYRRLERHDEALKDLNRAIELEPDFAWAITLRALTYQSLARHQEALAEFDRAIQLDPRDAWVIARRSEVNYEIESFEEALADLNRAIELDPDNAWALGGRGKTYHLMERYEEAIRDFNRAIELDSTMIWAIATRGATYRLMERYEEALADLNRAVEIDPNDTWVIANRGETYRLMGRYDEALADFNRAIELDPDDAWAIGSRGQTYQATGRYNEALKDLTHTIELDSSLDWAVASRDQVLKAMQGDEIVDSE
jgi:tetratricopeptide (TPR) repeat protein